MRKRGALSLWKVLLIIFASFVGVGGATALTLYLTGQFNEKIVTPDNMSVSQDVGGECVYNANLGRYEISGDSKLIITSTTEGVTKKKITLSFKDAKKTDLPDGRITDGNIIIPQSVTLNQKFDISVNPSYNSTIKQNWPLGGISTIVAKSESNEKVKDQTFIVAVDVPVYELKLSVSGTNSTEKTQKVVVSSMFKIDTLFTPQNSKYLYNDNQRLKQIFITKDGDALSYDEDTDTFVANKTTSGTILPTITAYVFKNAYYQEEYLKTHPNGFENTNDVIDYLILNPEKAVKETINIEIGSVSVDSVDFAVSGSAANVFVDRQYKISTHSTATADKSLGVEIKDSQGTSLPALYARVGIKLSDELDGVKIVGGDVIKKTATGISIVEYDDTFDYASDESAEYYILPNTLPKNPNDYYWNLSASKPVSGTLKLNFFYDDAGMIKQFKEEDEELSIVVSHNQNEQPVGWLKGREGKIEISVPTDADGEPVPTSSNDLSKDVNVDSFKDNTYKEVVFFLYSDGGTSVNIDEIFNCEAGASYDRYYDGKPFEISGNLYALKNNSTTIQALKSFEGSVKVVAAIVRTDVNGNPYMENGKYVIVNLSRAREVSVDSILSISQMTSSFKFNGIEKSSDLEYYVPSVSKGENFEDNILVFFELELRSNNYAADSVKVLNAYSSGNLRVVCVDDSGNPSQYQYVRLAGFAEEERDDGTIVEGMFIGGIIVDSTLVTAENAIDGLRVKLQLQYDNGTETFTQDVLQSDGSLNDHFYVYYQIPTSYEHSELFVENDLKEEGVVYVEVNQSTGITGNWETNNGGSANIDQATLEDYLKLTIFDQKGLEVKTKDGLYKFNYVEEDGSGHSVQNGYISVSSDGKVVIRSTNGENETTYLSVYVEDAITEKEGGISRYISAPAIEFNIRSEGVSYVKSDTSTQIGVTEFENSEDLSEITIRKYVNTGDEIQLKDLFEVYMTNDQKASEDSYYIVLDNTFVSSFTSKSTEIMKMIGFNDYPTTEGERLSDYVGEMLEKLRVNAPFRQDTTIKFNIVDSNNLYTITMNVVLLTDIKVDSNFEGYQEEFNNYLVEDPNRNYAISIFGNESYELDHYLKFVDSTKYSWSSIAQTAVDVTKLLVSKDQTSIASLEKRESKLYLTIADVQEMKPITITIYYGVVSSYAFSCELSLYINPNIVAYKETNNFIDLATLTTINIEDVYKFYKLTDYVKVGNKKSVDTSSFTYQHNLSQSKYIDVNNAKKIIPGTATLEYKIGEEYLQNINVFYVNNTSTKPVDFVVIDGENIITASAGNASLEFSVGYFDKNPENMIRTMVPTARIVKYNGNYAVLVLSGEEVALGGNFTIVERKENGCLSENPDAIETYTSIENFVYFDEYVVIETRSGAKLRFTLPVVVSKMGVIFANYDNETRKMDLADLFGNVETLQDKDIYQALIAGNDWTILTDSAGESVGSNFGFYYDRARAYAGNLNEPTIEIVEGVDGYISGIAEINGNKLKIKDSTKNSFVILKLTLSNLEGDITFSYYYRIKIVANIKAGSVVYPYEGEGVEETADAEYLDSTAMETITTYEYDAETRTYTIDLEEEFGYATRNPGKTRFVFDGTYVELIRAIEFDPNETYFKIQDNELVEAQDVTAENFADEEYYTKNIVDVLTRHEDVVNKVFVEGQETAEYSSYLNITFGNEENDGKVFIRILDANKKYEVVIARTYFSERGEIVGSTILYTFKINQSARYSGSVVIEKQGQDPETLVATNNVFVYDIDAGGNQIFIVPSLKKITPNGNEIKIDNIQVGMIATADDLVSECEIVQIVGGNDKIKFTTSNKIKQEGSILFYIYGDEKVAYVIRVNVNSYYKFNLLSEEVESGKKYNYNEIFEMINSNTEGHIENDAILTLMNEENANYININESEHTIEIPYLEEDKDFTIEGKIQEGEGESDYYRFSFTFTATAKNMQTKTGYTNQTHQYGQKGFNITIDEIAENCFDELGLGELWIVDNETRVNELTITPDDVAQDGYRVRKIIDVVYIWGEYERTTQVIYDYIVDTNVSLETNYPKPDGNIALTAEYIQSGTKINVFETAEFAEAKRVEVSEKAVDIERHTLVEVKDDNNVTAEITDTEITFTLKDTSRNGSATIVVTINNVVVEYNVVIVNKAIVSAVFNATNYADNEEKIYAEDVSSFENKEIFAQKRILNFKFNSSASQTSKYYIKMHDNITLTTITYEVYGLATEQNLDLGKPYDNMSFVGVYNSKTSTTSLEGLFEIEPHTTNRIIFKYADGTQIANVSAIVKKGNSQFTSFNKNDFGQEIALAVFMDKSGNQQQVANTTYKVRLISEFDVENVVTDETDIENDNYYVQELNAVGAQETLPKLFSMTGFGFKNTRLGTNYTAEMLANSAAGINLNIYGFDGPAIDIEDSVAKELDGHLKVKGYSTGITPNTNGSATDNTTNYITKSGDIQNGKIVDFKIHAQGADNNGNYVFMQLTYIVKLDEDNEISRNYNLLFKVNPNASVYFNNNTINGAAERNANGMIERVSNLSTHIVVVNGVNTDETDTWNVRNLTQDINAYLYGSTTFNSANSFTFECGMYNNNTINNNTYNPAEITGYDQDENPIYDITYTIDTNIVKFKTFKLGSKYYYVDAQNLFGFKVRVYYRIDGEVLPTMTLSSTTLREGESLAAALTYKDVSPATITIKDGDSKTYMVFANETKTFSKDVEFAVLVNDTVAEGYKKIVSVVGGLVGDKAYNGLAYQSGTNEWKSIDTGTIVKKSVGSGNWIPEESQKYTFMIAIQKCEQEPLGLKVYAYEKTIDSEKQSEKAYYYKDGSSFKEETSADAHSIGELYEQTIMTLAYTKGSNVNPQATDGDETFTGVVATFGGIDAFAIDKSIGYYDINNTATILSKSYGFKISGVVFEKDGQKIGEIGSINNLFTSAEKYFVSSGVYQGGNYSLEESGAKIPYVEGYYFGTGRYINGVRMIVTLTDGNGNTTELVSMITIEKGEVEPDLFRLDMLDNTGISKNSSYTGEILNDTLEVVLQPGATARFRLNRTWSSTTYNGDWMTISNNKSYAVTEYISITQHVKGLTTNLANGNAIDLVVDSTPTGVKFRYNGSDLTLTNNKGEITIAAMSFNYDNQSSMMLSINDVSELPTTLTENSYVTRKLYFIYTGGDETKNNGQTAQTYQTMQTFKVYPVAYDIEPNGNTNVRYDENGNIIVIVDRYYKVDEGSNKYYIISRDFWEYLNKKNGTGLTSLNNSYKYIYEINNNDVGGSGSAFIDERGCIITKDVYSILEDTITINIYVKVSGNDGSWGDEKGIFIGRVRVSISGSYTDTSYSIIDDNTDPSGHEVQDPKAHAYEFDPTKAINIKEIFDKENPVSGSTHYHVVSDTLDGVKTTFIRDNLDSFIFTETGKHQLRIIRTLYGDAYDEINAVFYIYDSSYVTESEFLLPINYTLPFSEVNAYLVNEDHSVTKLEDKTFSESKKEVIEFILEQEGKLNNYRYTLYVTTNSASDNIMVAKTANEPWTLANIDIENSVEFYKYTLSAMLIEELTQVKSEQSVTGDATINYLALNKDGTYKMWSVTYSIIPNAETQKYLLIDRDTSFDSSIRANVENADDIYVIGTNGILTHLVQNAKLDDDLNLKTIKTMVNVEGTTTHLRYVYNFFAYEQKVRIQQEVESNATFLLSGCNEAVATATGQTGKITYYTFNNETGEKTEVSRRTFENITEDIVDTYYVKIGERYYLVEIKFSKQQSA